MIKRFIQSKRGSVLEFAIVLPVLLFIIFGGILWGRVTAAQNAVETAAREAARTMAIHHDTDMAREVAREIIQNSLYTGKGPGGRSTFNHLSDITINDLGEHYEVTVSYHVPNPTPVLNRIMSAGDKPWGPLIDTSAMAIFKKELVIE